MVSTQSFQDRPSHLTGGQYALDAMGEDGVRTDLDESGVSAGHSPCNGVGEANRIAQP